jgi:hypothetical protein
MSLGTKHKGPDEAINFAVDWGDWLDTDRDGSADDTIASASWEADDGLTVGSSSETTTVATVAISGGTIGSSYKLRCTITTTTSGETFERFGYVHVVDR